MLPIKGLDHRSMVKTESVHILFLLEIVLFSRRVFMNSRFDLNIFYFIYKIYLQIVWTVFDYLKKKNFICSGQTQLNAGPQHHQHLHHHLHHYHHPPRIHHIPITPGMPSDFAPIVSTS